MDSATHLVVGIGLAGLSHLDPLVAGDPSLAVAVYIGTIAGSQAPDLDTLLRLKSNAAYIRHHRGITHSLPAIIVWTMVITAIAAAITGTPHLSHLAFWTLIAVGIHVFQDLFNVYGTQALRPISERWIAWNIIHIFDPIIFTLLVIGILLWIMQIEAPQRIFGVVFTIIVFYYIWRTLAHAWLQRSLTRADTAFEEGERYTVFPTYKIGVWHVVKRMVDGSYRIGDWSMRQFQWLDHVRSDEHPAVEASKSHDDIRALLYLTEYACAECITHKWGYEVRWTDVRYRHRKQYPFVAIVLYDRDLRPIDSYVGWLSQSKLERRLRLDTDGT